MNKSSILSIIALIIAVIIILNELTWVGKTDLAIMIIGLSIAIGLNSLAQLLNKK